jgi:DNA-binding CsgD family transcriptional regulator
MKEFSKDHFKDLKDLYITQNKTTQQCAVHFGCSEKTVINRLRESKIKKYNNMSGKENIYPLKGIYRYFMAGHTVRQCAEKYGCSVGTIRYRLRLLGIIFTKQRIDIDNKKIAKLYKSGKSMQYCAVHFKCSVSTIRTRLIDSGISISTTGVKRLIGLEGLYKKTGSMQACADHFKCSIFHIHNRLKDLGLD